MKPKLVFQNNPIPIAIWIGIQAHTTSQTGPQDDGLSWGVALLHKAPIRMTV